MSISILIQDLTHMNAEIKKTSTYLSEIKKKQNEIEQSIILFLQTHNLPGFKYEGKIYMSQSSKKYRKKNTTEKVEHVKNILEKSGGRVDNDIISDVFTVFKSKPVEIQKLKTSVPNKC